MSVPEQPRLLPYGHINAEFLEGYEEPPAAFHFLQPQAERDSLWKSFVSDLAGDLGSWLWPIWNNMDWEGSAAKHMVAMTEQDLRLLETARGFCDRPAFVHRIGRKGVSSQFPVGALQAKMFREEDGGHLATSYELYDPVLAGLRPRLPDDFERSIVALGGSLDIALKLRLQRPRPYQVSYCFGKQFSYLHATRADTPSMISGHCFAGCMGGVGVYELLLSLGIVLSPSSRMALQQYMVDIGDRRVFAGVHYPTDNVASWYTSLKLLSALKRPFNVEMQTFLKDAILRYSGVYRLLSTQTDKPIVKVIKELNQVLRKRAR